MNALILVSNLSAANDPFYPPDPPPANVLIDPGFSAWAQSFDDWLTTSAGMQYLDELSGEYAERAAVSDATHYGSRA